MAQVSRSGLEAHAGIASDPPRAACLADLKRLLTSNTLDALTCGFNDLTHPEMRLDDWMKQMQELLKERKIDDAKALYDSFRDTLIAPPGAGAGRPGSGNGDRRGRLLREFGKAVGPTLEKLCGAGGKNLHNIKPAAFSKAVRELKGDWESKRIKVEKGRHATPLELGDFSAYLSTYHRSQHAGQQDDPLALMEMPGQYGGDTPPHPSSHVLLDCVDRSILTMKSLRKPKRVTL